MLVDSSDEKRREVLATLEECQTALMRGGDKGVAQLVSVAILELRIKLNQIQDTELKILCDAMLREVEATQAASDSQPQPDPQPMRRARSPVLLKLVK